MRKDEIGNTMPTVEVVVVFLKNVQKGVSIMPRNNLKAARELAGYTQQQFADV